MKTTFSCVVGPESPLGPGTETINHRHLFGGGSRSRALSKVAPFRSHRIGLLEVRKNLCPIRGIIRRRLQAPDTDERLRDNEPARKYEQQPTDAHQRA